MHVHASVCVYEYNSSGVCWPPSPTLVRANTQKYISNIPTLYLRELTLAMRASGKLKEI